MASIAGEASSSSPPSTSIPPPRSCAYHAFLSFRGADTRKGFTDHLYAALHRKGIKTFRDDKYLERGEVISVELLKAIEESMFAITVISPNYASSSWCLDELHKIVECSKNMGLSIVPVFYGVEPSDVRYQKGSFEKAFRKHEERFGQDSERVKRWKGALVEVVSHSGWDSKDQHEATLVECIAEHVHKKLIPKLPSSTKNLVGIASRVEEVIRHIGIGLNDIRSIGIWGMGGIGKTTIARAVYEAIQGEFEVSHFLSNVREACERNSIVQIQEKLVAYANINASTYPNEYDGQRTIQNSFCNKKVLIVLDDVSDKVQLKHLAGEQDWFGRGSRIIITTRDIQLLKIHEVHVTYNVQGLVQDESFDLFCLNAFKQKKPIEGYLDLSKEVVKYSYGLPLALKVLGSHLYGRPVDVWRSAIEKIKSTSFVKIHDTLKISYEGLDFMENNIFLDIACFFKGLERDYVIEILENCGYNAKNDIAILVDRSLVTINQVSDRLDMHDLLQDMGRSIVIQESPNDLGKRSRLWSVHDIDLVLTNNKGTEAIQGIRSYCAGHPWGAEVFSNMTQLKFLNLDFPKFPNGLNYLPTSLKVLRSYGYPLKTLPLADQLYELVEIKLARSNIEQLWHGIKFLGELKHLYVSYCREIQETPDLSGVPVLERLVFRQCWRLTEVHPSVVHHKKLILLDLTGCTSLRTLPRKLEMSSLNELILDECSCFENRPEFGECMKSLSRLCLKKTAIKGLPTSLGCLVCLEDLNLECCEKLEDFPRISISELPKLRYLKLNYCQNLRCLPELPSSIRELELCFCDSLDIFVFDTLSKVHRVFASPSQDPGQVLLEMVIPAEDEIPSWFVHRQDGNAVSIPFCDYPLNERLGIALCSQIKPLLPFLMRQLVLFELAVHNGSNRFITKRIIHNWPNNKHFPKIGNHLYIICLTKDHSSDGFHQGTCFELSFSIKRLSSDVSITSAARWVSIEDIIDLKRSEIERPKQKLKMFDLGKSIEEMEQ